MQANDPQRILKDEPSGYLDPDTGSLGLNFFEQFISEGRTIVIVTHDWCAAECVRCKLQMHGGRIVDDKQGFNARVFA